MIEFTDSDLASFCREVLIDATENPGDIKHERGAATYTYRTTEPRLDVEVDLSARGSFSVAGRELGTFQCAILHPDETASKFGAALARLWSGSQLRNRRARVSKAVAAMRTFVSAKKQQAKTRIEATAKVAECLANFRKLVKQTMSDGFVDADGLRNIQVLFARALCELMSQYRRDDPCRDNTQCYHHSYWEVPRAKGEKARSRELSEAYQELADALQDADLDAAEKLFNKHVPFFKTESAGEDKDPS